MTHGTLVEQFDHGKLVQLEGFERRVGEFDGVEAGLRRNVSNSISLKQERQRFRAA